MDKKTSTTVIWLAAVIVVVNLVNVYAKWLPIPAIIGVILENSGYVSILFGLMIIIEVLRSNRKA